MVGEDAIDLVHLGDDEIVELLGVEGRVIGLKLGGDLVRVGEIVVVQWTPCLVHRAAARGWWRLATLLVVAPLVVVAAHENSSPNEPRSPKSK